ncbi:hypothetical protein J5Y03_11220 [Bacillus sp. RG28]|uniref:Uncharacterized protein n=1 Tax=Gottfriedia endophytica TaxID=2820819 RepID=A0A940NK94_9BACI|nr:hypothetical protein [Gottfriedia endophytica]MBP0725742.1 hypothetical protein [Gottfriedia endophytica]
MKVCEVCGSEEQMEHEGNELSSTRVLHLCESCITDRRFLSFENEELL